MELDIGVASVYRAPRFLGCRTCAPKRVLELKSIVEVVSLETGGKMARGAQVE